MKLLTILSDNIRNPISEVTELLAKHKVDIRDIDFNQMGADSYLSLAVSDYDKGFELLMGAGYQVISNDIVLIRTEDRPGALAEISKKLSENGVAIRSLTLVNAHANDPLVAVATSDNKRVRELYADQAVN
ncbi:MAG: hypothetical protein AB8B48_16060 [Pseudomonadales bacterium]